MPLIPFPNVPNVPGVPAIPRSPNFSPAAQTAALGIIQGALWRVLQLNAKWGIYDSQGKALADPRRFQDFRGDILGTLGGAALSTNEFEYSKETRISDFPVERGSFSAYNKVQMAGSPVVTLAFSGSESERHTFLNAIDLASKSTDLYSVVTPEVTYVDYNIERYDYQRRSSKGATLLLVAITLKEIRQVSAQFTIIEKPKKVDAVPNADNGKVQAATPNISTLKSIANKFPTLIDTVQGFFK